MLRPPPAGYPSAGSGRSGHSLRDLGAYGPCLWAAQKDRLRWIGRRRKEAVLWSRPRLPGGNGLAGP
eukprot:6145322-Heterocapsa_arctica.AAC.1